MISTSLIYGLSLIYGSGDHGISIWPLSRCTTTALKGFDVKCILEVDDFCEDPVAVIYHLLWTETIRHAGLRWSGEVTLYACFGPRSDTRGMSLAYWSPAEAHTDLLRMD